MNDPTEREYLTKLILMDVLDGVEQHFGADGLAQIVSHARLKNRAREDNKFIDELEAAITPSDSAAGQD